MPLHVVLEVANTLLLSHIATELVSESHQDEKEEKERAPKRPLWGPLVGLVGLNVLLSERGEWAIASVWQDLALTQKLLRSWLAHILVILMHPISVVLRRAGSTAAVTFLVVGAVASCLWANLRSADRSMAKSHFLGLIALGVVLFGGTMIAGGGDTPLVQTAGSARMIAATFSVAAGGFLDTRRTIAVPLDSFLMEFCLSFQRMLPLYPCLAVGVAAIMLVAAETLEVTSPLFFTFYVV